MARVTTIFDEIKDTFRKHSALEMLHAPLLSAVGDCFTRAGARVENECHVVYYGRPRAAEFRKRGGRIDMVVQLPASPAISIEFDDGLSIKYKSIEKLLQCDTMRCFFIVRGRKGTGSQSNLMWNLARIKSVRDDLVDYFTWSNLAEKIPAVDAKEIFIGLVESASIFKLEGNDIGTKNVSIV
jgi:hypothetical protein